MAELNNLVVIMSMRVLQLLKLCHVQPQACICIRKFQTVRVRGAAVSMQEVEES